MQSSSGPFVLRRPNDVYFEVSRDYAAACHGSIVRVGEDETPSGILAVRWDDEWIVFASAKRTASYARRSAVRIIVNLRERFDRYNLSTMRILFESGIEGRESLPILTTEQRNDKLLEDIGRQFQASDIPIPTEILSLGELP
jgi:hypothetical protein